MSVRHLTDSSTARVADAQAGAEQRGGQYLSAAPAAAGEAQESAVHGGRAGPRRKEAGWRLGAVGATGQRAHSAIHS